MATWPAGIDQYLSTISTRILALWHLLPDLMLPSSAGWPSLFLHPFHSPRGRRLLSIARLGHKLAGTCPHAHLCLCMYVYIYIYIYIYIGELVSVPRFRLSRVRNSTTSRVRNSTTSWGDHFHTTKIGVEDFCETFWCQFVFFLFSGFGPISDLFLLSHHLSPKMFCLFSRSLLKSCPNGVSKATIKIGFLKGVFLQQLEKTWFTKNLVHQLLISVSQK